MSSGCRKRRINGRCRKDPYRLNFISKREVVLKFLLCVLFIFTGGNFLYNIIFMPNISLKGRDVIIINYREKYVEPGYSGTYKGKDISRDIRVSGKVNGDKLGEYVLTYYYKDFRKKATRIVKVEDNSSPSIELVGGREVFVCPGGEYQEDGYRSFDNYDGDVTEKVKVDKNKDFIKYTVTDLAGNKKTVSRKIVYKDAENPKITLNGGSIVYAFVGEEYKEEGYVAVDNCDLDITKKVKASGKVDTSTSNTSIIKYSVSDSSGNYTEIDRRVVVSEHDRNGTIYLTFDDGPKAGVTDKILDILKEEGIKATFFVTNGGPDSLIQREYNEGHTVALHTASHDYSIIYASSDNYFNDLYSVQDRVKRLTGYESKIIRFPGGSSNTISRKYLTGIMTELTSETLNKGFRYYDWNISSGDAEFGSHTADEIYNNVVKQLSLNKVNMVLMHDIKTYTRDALKRIIQYGKENGYTFEAITEKTGMVTQRVNN